MTYAANIVRHLAGEWHGRYGLAPGPNHNKRDRSLKIAPHATDPDDVVVYSFAGDDVIALKRGWREQGLLPRGGRFDPIKAERPNAFLRSGPAAPLQAHGRDAAEAEKQDSNDEKARIAKARWLWARGEPAPNSLVEKYLTARAGIPFTPPATFRLLPSNPPKHRWPAMMAAVGLATEPEPGVLAISGNAISAVHLTYLDGAKKAPVKPDKRAIGVVKGSPICVAPPNDRLGLFIGEGIESALAVHLKTGLGAWAAGGGGFLPALADAVPSCIESVQVFVEDDPAGKRGAEELMHRLYVRGFDVIEWRAE